MSRAADVFEERLQEHFSELFGEEYADGELWYEYVEAFDAHVEDLDVLEGELAAEFQYLWENAWEDYFGDRVDIDEDAPDSPIREISELSDAMGQAAVDQLIGGSDYPDFFADDQVSSALPGVESAWEEALDEYVDWGGSQGERIIGPVFSTAASQANERFQDWYDSAEYTMTGDATEAVKDFIRDNYEEYEDLAHSLGIDPDDDMY